MENGVKGRNEYNTWFTGYYLKKIVTVQIPHTPPYIFSLIFARFYEIRRTNRQIDIL